MLSGVHLEIGASAPYPIIYNTKWPSGHPKSGPKSIKNRSKRASKSIRKVIEKSVEIGIDFLTIFGPFWPPTWRAPARFGPQLGGARGSNEAAPGVQRIRFVGSSWPPGPKWPPGRPRAPSKLDFYRLLIDFGSILGRFWRDFGVDVERFLYIAM